METFEVHDVKDAVNALEQFRQGHYEDDTNPHNCCPLSEKHPDADRPNVEKHCNCNAPKINTMVNRLQHFIADRPVLQADHRNAVAAQEMLAALYRGHERLDGARVPPNQAEPLLSILAFLHSRGWRLSPEAFGVPRMVRATNPYLGYTIESAMDYEYFESYTARQNQFMQAVAELAGSFAILGAWPAEAILEVVRIASQVHLESVPNDLVSAAADLVNYLMRVDVKDAGMPGWFTVPVSDKMKAIQDARMPPSRRYAPLVPFAPPIEVSSKQLEEMRRASQPEGGPADAWAALRSAEKAQ